MNLEEARGMSRSGGENQLYFSQPEPHLSLENCRAQNVIRTKNRLYSKHYDVTPSDHTVLNTDGSSGCRVLK